MADPVKRSWPELTAGTLSGIWAGQQFGVDGGGALFCGLFGAFLAYLVGCAFFPTRFCWLCKGRAYIGDGRGNLANRPCPRCRRKRILVRPGARLIGRGGD